VQERLLSTALPIGNGDPYQYGRGRIDAAAAVGSNRFPAEPAAAMNASISVNPSTAVMGDVVSITVSLRSAVDGSPIQAANVSMTVLTAAQTSFTTSGYTDANGNALFRLRTRTKDGVGPYYLRVQASKAGYTASVIEASFTVR
jgi:hypothetical protein